MAKIDPNESCPCGSGKRFADCHEPHMITNKPPKISQHIALGVIPEPDPGTRAIFEKTGEGTVLFQSYESEIAMCCGSCESPLTIGLSPNQVQELVLRCKSCGAFNDTASG